MIRKIKIITCKKCGHTFLAFDIEDNATAGSMTIRCPHCGSIITSNWSQALETLFHILKQLGSVMKKREGWI